MLETQVHKQSRWNHVTKKYEPYGDDVRGIGIEYLDDAGNKIGKCWVRDEGRKYMGEYETPDGEWHVVCAEKRSASIWAVKIDEEHRGMGHGSKMMCEVMDVIVDMDYGDAYLVCTGGIAAYKAYERAGFIMTERADTPYNGRMEWRADHGH